jgi:hypothetical protein
MNHTEQKIKELEELATEFNNKLKDLREEAKREEFKVGDWVYCNGDNHWMEVMKRNHEITSNVFKVEKISDEYLYVGFGGANTYIKCFRKATTQEIENFLIEEAKKRGFDIGGLFSHPSARKPHLEISRIRLVSNLNGSNNSHINENYFKNHGGNFLCIDSTDGGCYPLPECKLVNACPEITIGDRIVEFFPDHIQVGCTRVELETIKQIANHYKL